MDVVTVLTDAIVILYLICQIAASSWAGHNVTLLSAPLKVSAWNVFRSQVVMDGDLNLECGRYGATPIWIALFNQGRVVRRLFRTNNQRMTRRLW